MRRRYAILLFLAFWAWIGLNAASTAVDITNRAEARIAESM